LNDQKLNLVKDLTHAGVPPLKIKSALMQQTPNPSVSTLNTIYNARNTMRRTYLVLILQL
jgi:hypothetical protein